MMNLTLTRKAEIPIIRKIHRLLQRHRYLLEKIINDKKYWKQSFLAHYLSINNGTVFVSEAEKLISNAELMATQTFTVHLTAIRYIQKVQFHLECSLDPWKRTYLCYYKKPESISEDSHSTSLIKSPTMALISPDKLTSTAIVTATPRSVSAYSDCVRLWSDSTKDIASASRAEMFV